MIKVILSDLSRTLLCPVDVSYTEGLNALHTKLQGNATYDIWEHYTINKNLFSFYESMKNRVDVYIFTTGNIQEWTPLKEKLETVCKGIFSSLKLGIVKNESEAYMKISQKIGYKPSEIIFIDDNLSNIKAAKQAGMETVHFISEQQAIEAVKKLLK